MKKINILFALLAVLILASCTPQAENWQVPLGNEIDFSKKDMVSVAATNIAIGSDGSRAISKTDETTNLLVYYDTAGNMKPFVFRNAEGAYILFKVKDSYPIGTSIIGVDFEGMYYSDTEPKIGKAGEPGAEYPVIDFESGIQLMDINGQIIINMDKSRGAFLTPIDFSRFFRNPDSGLWEYSGIPAEGFSDMKYDLGNAFTVGSSLYLIRYNAYDIHERAIYRIEVDDLSKAVAMTNPEVFSAESIIAVTSDYIYVQDIREMRYILRTDGLYGAAEVYERDETPFITRDGYVTQRNNFQPDGLYRIGDSFWFLDGSQSTVRYVRDKDGNLIKHPLADGFYIHPADPAVVGYTYVAPDKIKAYDPEWVMYLDADGEEDRSGFMDDREGKLVTMNGSFFTSDKEGNDRIESIATELGGNLHDWENRPIEVKEITSTGYTAPDGTAYSFRFDEEGTLYVSPVKIVIGLEELRYSSRHKPAEGRHVTMTVDGWERLRNQYGLDAPARIINIEKTEAPDVFMLYFYITDTENRNFVHTAEFDLSGEGSLEYVKTVSLDMALPGNFVHTIDDAVPLYDSITVDRDGQRIAWLDHKAHKIHMVDIASGESVTKEPTLLTAKEWLKRVGDRLYYQVQGHLGKTYTYSVGIDDFLACTGDILEPVERLESTREMEIIPLVEFTM